MRLGTLGYSAPDHIQTRVTEALFHASTIQLGGHRYRLEMRPTFAVVPGAPRLTILDNGNVTFLPQLYNMRLCHCTVYHVYIGYHNTHERSPAEPYWSGCTRLRSRPFPWQRDLYTICSEERYLKVPRTKRHTIIVNCALSVYR